MNNWFALLTFLTVVDCHRIDCDWGREYLCGDQCLSDSKTCYCGNDTLSYRDSLKYNCCHQPNSCHVSNKTKLGDIECQGEKKWWQELCDGTCLQSARYGDNTLSCKDQSQCYLEIFACRGMPQCAE